MQSRHPIEILLVEDNPGDVLLTQEALDEARLPNNLSVAEDGMHALRFLKREGEYSNAPRPDLILLDLNMPRKGGHEVLDEIKRDADLRAIPVVILTTSDHEDDVRRSYDAHANCYICKPTGFDDFFSVVRSIEDFWMSTVHLPPRHGNV
ncbi:response regulator [Deinococcus pimensis]|uniref:response regulator n=1 Tax=Deinococcus pimensis TaxID=309888 RepID=UPI000487432C|nr:response regulator [Deinococcus pimensis]